ncbi:hypothetical protein BMS3Abin03_00589 [bacterium BMS3Abin03]|nr:hypothetical protein BMS3Abin03_00589 [bacterium BMS3Abin03]
MSKNFSLIINEPDLKKLIKRKPGLLFDYCLQGVSQPAHYSRTVCTAARQALAAENIYVEIIGRHKKKYLSKVLGEVVSLGKNLTFGWLALPIFKKVTFAGFLGRLLKTAIREKHIILLKKESRDWIIY